MRVAIEPEFVEDFANAVSSGGGQPCHLSSDVTALIWTDYHKPHVLSQVLDENPQISWLQLPFAGVDAFKDIVQRKDIVITCAKGAYRQPVAEHALALCLALGRAIPNRVLAASWGEKFAVSLYESKVLIIGGGGIAEELVALLEPFGCPITVVRKNHSRKLGQYTVSLDELDDVLPTQDFVVVAASLTDQTRGLFDLDRFAKMKRTAYFVNIARGSHVVTDDLVAALERALIAGAAIDVTDPEPLPDGHALWNNPKCIVTPHTADTPAQVTRMLADRIRENTRAFLGQGPWIGLVDPHAGY
jgi:phosphoglycerate dehydrogenase-like enzyme